MSLAFLGDSSPPPPTSSSASPWEVAKQGQEGLRLWALNVSKAGQGSRPWGARGGCGQGAWVFPGVRQWKRSWSTEAGCVDEEKAGWWQKGARRWEGLFACFQKQEAEPSECPREPRRGGGGAGVPSGSGVSLRGRGCWLGALPGGDWVSGCHHGGSHGICVPDAGRWPAGPPTPPSPDL